MDRRRGRVMGMRSRGDLRVVDAHVPLSGMFGYATDLRSRSQGRATYSMEFAHYQQTPKEIGAGIAAKARA